MNVADSISCREDELKCAGGYCVPKSSICDGKTQCTNGDDEPCGKLYWCHEITYAIILILVEIAVMFVIFTNVEF